MAEGPDAARRSTLVTGGLGANSAEFREVARTIASVDTLDGFLRDMRARYPEIECAVDARCRPVQQPVERAGRCRQAVQRETHRRRSRRQS